MHVTIGADQSVTAASQGLPIIAGKLPETSKTQGRILLQDFRGNIDLRLLGSRTMR